MTAPQDTCRVPAGSNITLLIRLDGKALPLRAATGLSVCRKSPQAIGIRQTHSLQPATLLITRGPDDL